MALSEFVIIKRANSMLRVSCANIKPITLEVLSINLRISFRLFYENTYSKIFVCLSNIYNRHSLIYGLEFSMKKLHITLIFRSIIEAIKS
ncbi:hypothetical protein MCHI_000338 [Candidatus Magnetoovum chiemensis]|nr:hypothetical protein MCHI_000338 [Candidatus Magnetoovum chiemensis]